MRKLWPACASMFPPRHAVVTRDVIQVVVAVRFSAEWPNFLRPHRSHTHGLSIQDLVLGIKKPHLNFNLMKQLGALIADEAGHVVKTLMSVNQIILVPRRIIV